LGNAKERLHQLLPNAGLDPPHHAEIIKMRVPSGLTARLRDEDRRGKAMIKQLMVCTLAGYYFTIYTGCL